MCHSIDLFVNEAKIKSRKTGSPNSLSTDVELHNVEQRFGFVDRTFIASWKDQEGLWTKKVVWFFKVPTISRDSLLCHFSYSTAIIVSQLFHFDAYTNHVSSTLSRCTILLRSNARIKTCRTCITMRVDQSLEKHRTQHASLKLKIGKQSSNVHYLKCDCHALDRSFMRSRMHASISKQKMVMLCSS